MLQLIIQAFRLLLKNRSKAFLSVLGIIIGVVVIITMLAVGEGTKKEIVAKIEQLGVRQITIRQCDLSAEQLIKARSEHSEGLTMEDAYIIKKYIKDIKTYALSKIATVSIRGFPPTFTPEFLMVNADFQKVKHLEIAEGRFFSDLDFSRRLPVCVIGADIQSKLGKLGKVGKLIRIENNLYKVIGILNNQQQEKIKTLKTRNLNNAILLPLGIDTLFPKVFTGFPQSISEINIELKQHKSLEVIAETIKRILEVKHRGVQDFQVITPNELVKQSLEAQKVFNIALASIAFISMLIGGIGVMNIMLASISHRKVEIGIRRAIGATKIDIAKQFMTESLILTLLGAFVGVIFGIFISHFLGKLMGWNIYVAAWSICLSLAIVCLVGIISGVYPAIKAAKLDPIKAIRQY